MGFTFWGQYAAMGQSIDYSFPSCEVGLAVRRGTTWKCAPQQSLTVNCPVTHCGKPLSITWCKLINVNSCERINKTENIEIRQHNNSSEDKLISDLTFKLISVHDDGLYRCVLNGYKYEIGHIINISVSDTHEGVEITYNTDNTAVASLSATAAASAGDAASSEATSWLPYFYICITIVLLVFTLTVLILLHFYGCEYILTFKPTMGQEISTHIIPDLPRRSAPTTPVLQAHFVLNDIYSTGTPLSPAAVITSGDQPLANTADESQGSDSAGYSVINHKQSGNPARNQHAVTKQDKNPEYASISVS
ncbi:B- and T-lymphocyte attenuator isoform X2 [Lates calcarifer]|uniref:B- and T-lymphocyte attenuator isoform X2 n=1 Tax=Lates calcarifer TaxID=8187 RepID=A0AAJ7PNH0_LATCA|nr:B- and T-lymphocyte attenuator isoform X2 [Lates calcarifer]